MIVRQQACRDITTTREDQMTVRDEYLGFKDRERLSPGKFKDRVILQGFLRDRLDDIWREGRTFANGGLFRNHMTQFAIGFAYYDCRPSSFCKTRCYGLPIAGINDYAMLSLAVITSESLKTGDDRYLRPLREQLRGLRYLKIGHWGDAVLEQVPVVSKLAEEHPHIKFWWYTRKQEIALSVNERQMENLKAYLSLDPTTSYPSKSEYPFGITYLLGDGQHHGKEGDILADQSRLVALFPLKRGRTVEDPCALEIESHAKLCPEKEWLARGNGRTRDAMCLSCIGLCRY